MQCNNYVVNEAMVSVVICVAIVHTSPAIRQNITFDITTNGTAKGKNSSAKNCDSMLNLIFIPQLGWTTLFQAH